MSIKKALGEINNAVLDLMGSEYNTYERPLRRLGQALKSAALEEINAKLTEGLDLEAFLSEAKRGGMVSSHQLVWPVEREEELGLTILLIERGASDPQWFLNFAHTYYYSGSKISGDIRKISSSLIIPFNRDYRAYVEGQASVAKRTDQVPLDMKRVFIVHGRDEAPRETVARFISLLGFEPIILHEQVSRGMTVAEKLDANANVGFAVVLLTPDDVGRGNHEAEMHDRARQNVLLELGYFVGKLGRSKVCALKKGDIEIPSDFMGVVYVDFDGAGAWRQKLGAELDAAGYPVDWNKVMRP